MNQPPHMHEVRDYFIFIDAIGNIWKLYPAQNPYRDGPPFTITLIHKA